jgi:hypothetical protein
MKVKRSFIFAFTTLFWISVVGLINAQQHFQPVDNTGLTCAIIIQDATIDGLPLEKGDELAVFDGSLCVGAGVYDGVFPLTFPAILEFISPLGDRLEGAKPENPMEFKGWQKSTGIEGEAIATFASGGYFGDLITVVNPLVVSMTDVDDPHYTLPTQFNLQQNFPNPFNPKTTIGYHLPTSVQTRILIYDMTGRLVNTLIDAYQSAGHHSVTWNGCDHLGFRVSSGLYFARMEAGSYTATRKLNIVK